MKHVLSILTLTLISVIIWPCRGDYVVPEMNLHMAQHATEEAIKKAMELGTKMNIAVVDVGANLVSFARMDGAWLGSVDIAIKKARTATFFNMPSGDIGTLSQPGGSLYNIEHSNGGLISFPGGLPINGTDGTLIGGIGVSGDSVANDTLVAKAGQEAFKQMHS